MMQAHRAALAATLALATYAAPAHAQHMNAPDTPCREGSTAQMVRCFQAAYAREDGELNAWYTRVMAVLTPPERQKLRQSERQWIAYRDGLCGIEYGLYGGGTGGPPTELACRWSLTHAHLGELRKGFTWVVRQREP